MAEMKSMLWARIVAFVIIASMLVSLFVFMVIDMNPKGSIVKVDGYKPWEPETLELMNQLPLQDGGRVKPFSTHAQFTMLRLRGDRKIQITGDSGEAISIKPTAWMMDCLFRPTLAVAMPTFRVDNGAAIEAIGLKALGRRDRYSYKQLEEGIPKLFELAQSYESIEEKRRDAVQKQVIDLAYNVRSYQFLIGYFGFARAAIEMKGANPDGTSRFADFSTVMGTAPMISNLLRQNQSTGEPIPPNLETLLQQVLDGANYAKYGLVLLPPKDSSNKNWRSAGDRIMDVMTAKAADASEACEEVKLMETAVRSVQVSEAEFRKQLQPLVKNISDRAAQRGEYRAIDAENRYNRKNLMLYAMIWFLLGLLVAGAFWFLRIFEVPRWIQTSAKVSSLVCTGLGLLYMIIVISMRCYIMWRPPVGNLYDTIIFICTVAVIVLLLIEWFTKEAIAATLAPLMGLSLVLLARRFEVGDAKDHMDPLVAVLNSNYWLTTHVITVTMGYAAGLLTAFLSMTYVLLTGLGLGKNLRSLLKMVTTAAYGGLCLTLFLSLVGTVLGGIWANDSWGRFWGWDPKENGALMIVLWSLIMLHARFGGLIREWGFHLASIFMACIVSFSWWHVNFLGEGLHNYGFTSGKNFIWFFYLGVLLTILFGVVLWVVEQVRSSSSGPPGDQA
ncbi:MAG: cytochrome c biosis protein CcsA [Verrucomicrobiota bacterium]|jgi:ABC-type transport system involved in cytochrome c biogenesis permease subunit